MFIWMYASKPHAPYKLSPIADNKEFAEYILKLVFDGELRVLPPTKASPNSKGFILCLKNRGSQNPQFCTLPQPLNEKVELAVGQYLTLRLPDRNMLS